MEVVGNMRCGHSEKRAALPFYHGAHSSGDTLEILGEPGKKTGKAILQSRQWLLVPFPIKGMQRRVGPPLEGDKGFAPRGRRLLGCGAFFLASTRAISSKTS